MAIFQNKIVFFYKSWKLWINVLSISAKLLCTFLHLHFWYSVFFNGHQVDTSAYQFMAQTGVLAIYSGGTLTLLTILLVMVSFYYATEQTGFITVNALILFLLFLFVQVLGTGLIMYGIANNN
ncbi:MAG: hypothetical protein ACRCU5_11185 [Rhizobiaceae bacterium]